MTEARAAMDRAYANSDFIPDGPSFANRWRQDAAAFRAGMGQHAKLDQPYGPGTRQQFDLFTPPDVPRGLLVYVHGGYWHLFDRKSWSHLAAGALAHGWAVAMPSYTLAPTARIGDITQEIAQSVRTAAAQVPGPVVVTGHSAGGHLAARMGCNDIAVADITRVVPISPLSELVPLMETSMNDDLRIDAKEAAHESPARLSLRHGTSAHVWVGGAERPSFLWQARTLSENWACDWTVAPAKHHFDVIDDLVDPHALLTRLCVLEA